MKKITCIISLILQTFGLFSQSISISDNLFITPLSEHTYLHTCHNNNGIVYINQQKALIVSTPDSDLETQNLINWVQNEKGAQVIGYVADRWHPDAMEGLDVIHANGIASYAFELTCHIAKEKHLPVPQIGFNPKKEIKVGDQKVICHFLGEAHTTDGIVVYIPNEQILFGGNEIRNFNGWVGNIGDANLSEWSATATKIKQHYGEAKIVIPGHGKFGGSELIDYTIQLYAPCAEIPALHQATTLEPKFKTDENIHIIAQSESIKEGKQILENTEIVLQDSTKYIQIKSPVVNYNTDKQRINSQTGNLKIYDKMDGGEVLRTNVDYNQLITYKLDDIVGYVVIIKEITSH